MKDRMIARLILTFALLVLGGVALARLPLDYLPRQSFPELTVGLDLGEDRDPGEVAREWIEPIESAIRSLGRVRGMAGEVRTDGATLTVRFAPGTDPERKAARLDSELARLRTRLPEGASLWVDPAAERDGDFLALVWLSGVRDVRDDADARAAAEALRAVPGVRAVELVGVRDEEVRVELAAGAADPWGQATNILGEARRWLRVPALGWSRAGNRRRPVIAAAGGELASLPVGALPLGSAASIHDGRKPPRAEIRFRGRPARALYVWRTRDASPLEVDSTLRRHLAHLPGGVRGEVGWSDADPLRDLVRRLALAGLLGMILAAAAGAWRSGLRGALALALAVPAVVTAAANAFLLTGVPLDVTTLTALAIAAASLLPLAALRLTRRDGFWTWGITAIAAAAVVPVAVALAGAELGPLLAEPALALLLAVAAGVGAVAMLPTGVPVGCAVRTFDIGDGAHSAPYGNTAHLRHPSPPGRGAGGEASERTRPNSPRTFWTSSRSLIQSTLRDPGTVLLAATTAAYLAIAVFGAALVPRPGSLRPDQANLSLTLRLPPGATLEETVRRAAKAEELLAKAEEMERFWSYSIPGLSRLTAELRSGARTPEGRSLVATRLRYGLGGAGAVEISSGARASSTGNTGFLADLEDRAETDEPATSYRVVLRGADLGAVRTGYDRLLQRLTTLKIPSYRIAGWGEPAIHLVLRPRAGTTPAEAASLAARLRRESAPPPALILPPALPGGPQRSLTVVPAGTPLDSDRAVPQIATLLEQPMILGGLDGRVVVPTALVAPSEEFLHPRVARQSGRFVVPVEIQLPYSAEEVRKEKRKDLDRSLSQLPLPPGCDLERPVLGFDLWQRDRLRVIALALSMPLLLFAVAACRLGSLLRGTTALIPLALGLVAALPLVGSGLGHLDELTVFTLAASLALALPSAAEVAAGSAEGGGRLYRDLRRQVPWLVAAAPALVLGLAAATLGADPASHPWSVPLRAAAVAGGAALAGSALLTPALLLAGSRWRHRDPEAERQRRRPPVWSEPGEPILEVRSLTKTYGGSFRALTAVDFTLTPGIVGLLGPNGAGKTTLLRIVTGLLEPTRGSVRFRSVPITAANLAAYRQGIGFLPQEFNAYPGFTAEQFLDHWARERGMNDPRARRDEIDRLLAAVGLAEHAGRKVRDYSGGMRQRVGIARALLGAPPILVVDEPTTGLDVESRNRFRQILLEQAGERIVIFSTHIASDVEAAARRILLLHRGRLRFDGTPEALVERARGRVFRALVTDADLLAFGHRYRTTSRVRVLEGIDVRAIARPGEEPAGEIVEPNLEEAYLAEVDRADAGADG
ncbi:MAG: type transport system ATP-binding protein [Acidobacteriota bacterium]|jgi:ABC-type multidrug transport system ATPase subunit|nr:type transport system ATP-binding protein [Acidobacteriota bacterium]